MSKLHYANIPIGYACITLEEYVDLHNRLHGVTSINGNLRAENDRFERQIETLQASLESAEADRDSNKNSLIFWVDRARGFEAEIEKLKQENASLRDTVSFYVPKWEEDEESCNT